MLCHIRQQYINVPMIYDDTYMIMIYDDPSVILKLIYVCMIYDIKTFTVR